MLPARALPILATALLLAGCATLFNSATRTVAFGSTPTEAEIWIGGTLRGTTPFSLELDNHTSHQVVFRKQGYRDVTCDIQGDGWRVLGNSGRARGTGSHHHRRRNRQVEQPGSRNVQHQPTAGGSRGTCTRGSPATCTCGSPATCTRGSPATCTRGSPATCTRGSPATCTRGSPATCTRGSRGTCTRDVWSFCGSRAECGGIDSGEGCYTTRTNASGGA